MNKEEAIKVLNARPYTGEVREALETLIPELNNSEESKEERVRKDIVGLIKFALNDGSAVSPGSHTTKEEALAYLEKQKEHQNNSDAHNESSWAGMISSSDKDKNLDEIAQDYIDGVKEYNPEPTWDLIQTAVCYGYHYYEQKEQKPFWNPTEEDVVLFNKAVTTNTTLTPQERAKLDIIRMKFKHCPYIEQKEQQPAEWNANNKAFIKDCARILDENGYAASAERLLSMFPIKSAEWSEEDKDMRDTIIRDLKRLGGDLVKVNPAYKEEIDWLKLLHERFILQPKQEWSEEDERMLNQLIYDVEYHKKEGLISAKQNKATKTLYNGIEKCYDEKIAWLKSLHPYWKPSEEQMKALLNAEGFLRAGLQHNSAKAIAELYEQLKQL